MSAPTPSKLDYAQVLQGSFDEDKGRLRVETEATVINGAVEVAIDASTDNIQIRDPNSGNNLAINSDGSANIIVSNALITKAFDYIAGSFPSSTVEVYTYKSGGSSGTIVGVITVAYTDSTKNNISSVTKS